jgi:5-methylcytosine-specific restriction endonuclease McrA
MGKKGKRVSSINEIILGKPKTRTADNPLNVVLSGLPPTQPRRDSRRSFTYTQKVAIFRQQKGKCAICRKQLDFTLADFDHKKPFESGGKTTVKNGEAIHKDCHARKTQKETLKKVEKKRKKRKPSLSLF